MEVLKIYTAKCEHINFSRLVNKSITIYNVWIVLGGDMVGGDRVGGDGFKFIPVSIFMWYALVSTNVAALRRARLAL